MFCDCIPGASGAAGASWASSNGPFELVLMVMCGDITLLDKTNANVKPNVSSAAAASLPNAAAQRRTCLLTQRF